MVNEIKTMTVYCGSWFGNNEKYKNAAVAFGQDMAKNNIELVYGAGIFGMMGTVAKTVADNGGKVLGITIKEIWEFERGAAFTNENTGQTLDIQGAETVFTADLAERKKMLQEKGDAIVALPGSTGTLDELYEVIVMNHLGLIQKPIILLNLDGYYDLTYKQIEHTVKEGFAAEKVLKNFRMVNTPEEIIPAAKEMMEQFATGSIETKIGHQS